ncbi:MAG: formate--tetrahydrofolate ligase [Candidatus Ratteibacteria bacterium]|nr:formate--tetrahydrofolate ligase [Candidatus Ratteibacteria bacterium]
MKPIIEIAKNWGLQEAELKSYGHYAAKVSLEALKRLKNVSIGQLVIVTAMTPTNQGEGKTTTAIGLSQAFNRLGKRAIPTLREPSLGPLMGIKGGATGGGAAQVLPAEEINLHFTGDIHAVGAAHNLLAALIDNSLFRGNNLDLKPERFTWPRVIDTNDRALREILLSSSGKIKDNPYRSFFEITAASEIMAVLCLSESLPELKEKIGKIIIGLNRSGRLIRVKDLGVEGTLAVLLKEALLPNLVQTSEGGLAFVHGGPFANIAHGCNSILAIKMALKLADFVITETGFGLDLGAEKFMHLVAAPFNLSPRALVIVASLRALKMHGGEKADFKAGLENLEKHIENGKRLGLPVVVALNKFTEDTPGEIEWLENFFTKRKIPFAVSEIWQEGGAGAEKLAGKVLAAVKQNKKFKKLYNGNDSFRKKVEAIACGFYGAGEVDYSSEAEKDIALIGKNNLAHLPVCMAKTHKSLSDNPRLLGRPRGFKVKVQRVRPAAGAGFLVVYCGKILTLPGLPLHPRAERIGPGSNGGIEERNG